ncbi:UPF0070 protein YfgM [Buchnera aphidicola (Eriosoma lanigerum)]|uniref:YfgM family protein n=1 Tax=Buchnera aphidicola TaxID=9 RepID=UPI003463C00E
MLNKFKLINLIIYRKIVIFFIYFLIFFCIVIFFLKKNENHKNNIIINNYENFIMKNHENNSTYTNEINKFIIENKNIYGILLALRLAKIYVDSNNLNSAIKILQFCLPYTLDSNLYTIIQLRISRIQLEQHDINHARATLYTIKDDSWRNMIEDIQGYIYILENNNKSALHSWKKSLFLQTNRTIKNIMKFKICSIIQ